MKKKHKDRIAKLRRLVTQNLKSIASLQERYDILSGTVGRLRAELSSANATLAHRMEMLQKTPNQNEAAVRAAIQRDMCKAYGETE